MHRSGTFKLLQALGTDADQQRALMAVPTQDHQGDEQQMDQSLSADRRTDATHLLWTGGWDSTFRLLSLAMREHRPVQPYYVLDDVKLRPSVPAERHAMACIRDRLERSSPRAAALVLPTVECTLQQIAPNEDITQQFENSLRSAFIGGQYEWLARFCAERGIEGLELSIHRDDRARDLLLGLVDASRTRLDRRHAGDPRYELFKYFRFPLFDKTKQQMRIEAIAAGFEDLMKLTWFCHRPAHGKPCGRCNPCIYTIEEGLADRVPLRGRIRYHLRVLPRLKHWMVSHPEIYLAMRAPYKRIRSLGHRPSPSHS